MFSSPRDEYNESNKYFKDMRTIFNVGSIKEFNEIYTITFMAKVSDHVHNGYSYEKSLKLARFDMERKMESLNPLKYSFNKDKGELYLLWKDF